MPDFKVCKPTRMFCAEMTWAQIVENKRKLAHEIQQITAPVSASGTPLFEIEQSM